MKETKSVEAYSLGEFCEQIEPLLKEGWSFDFESNENYPQSYGSYLSAILVKKEEVQPVQEDQTEPKKAGRKPKVVTE